MKTKQNMTNLLRVALLFAATTNGILRLVESASIRATKNCFEVGENIRIRFINVKGEGVFLGLYPDAHLPNHEALPALESPSLIDWVLTCGELDDCDIWPSRGFAEFPSDDLEQNDYVIAISGDQAGLTPQAVTRTFQVGDCSLDTSTFFAVSQPAPVSRLVVHTPTQPEPVPTVPETPIPPPIPPPVPAPVPVPVPVQASSDSLIVVSDKIDSVIDDARFQIENLIRNDDDLTGKVSTIVRME